MEEQILLENSTLEFSETPKPKKARLSYLLGWKLFTLMLTNKRLMIIRKLPRTPHFGSHTMQGFFDNVSSIPENISIPLDHITEVTAKREWLLPYLSISYQSSTGQKFCSFWSESELDLLDNMDKWANTIESAKRNYITKQTKD
jgi:hypothetical protein